MKYSDAISQLKLATTLGVSRVQVRRLIEKGFFILDENNKLSLSQAREAFVNYQKDIGNKKLNKVKAQSHKLLNEINLKDVSDSDIENFKEVYSRWVSNVEIDPMTVLNSAKAYLAAIQAKQEKIKLDELEGRVFSIDVINRDAKKCGELIRTKLMTIPARVATLCEGRTARDIEDIINNEINKALEELQKLFI